MSKKKNADHWAFLEDIEAPMWVDLTVEATVSNKELDDKWFHRSHKFHQLPSRKLKAAFKHIDSGGKLEIDVGGSSSPKISSSVSKSRGKYYANGIVGIDFRMSLSGKECLTKDADGEALRSQCGNEMISKSALEVSKLRSHFDQEDDGTGRVVLQLSDTSTMPCTNNSSSSNHLEHDAGVSDPKSSIASGSMPGAESKHIIGRRSELLSVIKQSLRKSCTTRMAVRGQITDVQKTNGPRASVGKSSVGSCSVHSQNAKDITASGTQRTSRTPESKNVERLFQESKTRDKAKTSIYGACQSTNNTSYCGNSGEPMKTKAKPGSNYPHLTLNKYSSTTSTSLKINIINRASECDRRGRVGMPKNIKTSTATKPAQCVNNNGSISKHSKSATVNTVPEHSSNRRKNTVPKGIMARISDEDSVTTEVGKSVVTKSSQPRKVTTSKAPLTHRRPLAPVNHNNDQGLHRRPLAPLKQTDQRSSTFAGKTMMKGKSDASTKPFSQGKENIAGKLITSKRQGNDKGIAARGMAEKSNKMKLNGACQNDVQGLLSQKEPRRDPALTSKWMTEVN